MKDVEKLNNKEFMASSIDLKLIILLYLKRWFISVIWLVAGAAIGGGLYFLTHVVYGPAREYEAVSKLYLTFAADDDGDAYQYYNGYTWNDLMGTEPIMDRILADDTAGKYGEAEVRKAIKADILSDIRLLTITCRTEVPSKTDEIIRATEEALVDFGREMIEFERIEVIDHGSAALVVLENNTKRAVAAGAALGFVFSLVWIAYICIMEDHIYVPAQAERSFALPVLGYTLHNRGNDRESDSHLTAALTVLKEKSIEPVCIVVGLSEKMSEQVLAAGDEGSLPGAATAVSVENDSDCILTVEYGLATVRLVERDISLLKQKGCRIHGIVITGADPVLYRAYFLAYGSRKRGK